MAASCLDSIRYANRLEIADVSLQSVSLIIQPKLGRDLSRFKHLFKTHV
ncbi:hypothetical protein RBSH_01356 [Rhodopirellula baltica SH28]|uniref:Uncharacterized protein n=2 Tax=Rhodopirellula baltica TaxID=265606 RepID=F2AM34_RHOBT|nr:hypothetical protein RBWH47_01364 [Rhodopirellula baltica WH47]EKK03298.1 hypothetical protein RBSH_01356 [Rhodopirellula baltica SH28]